MSSKIAKNRSTISLETLIDRQRKLDLDNCLKMIPVLVITIAVLGYGVNLSLGGGHSVIAAILLFVCSAAGFSELIYMSNRIRNRRLFGKIKESYQKGRLRQDYKKTESQLRDQLLAALKPVLEADAQKSK